MSTLGQYVMGLIAGALICSVVMSFVTETTHRELIRMLCGIFMTVLIIAPLPGIQWKSDLLHWENVLRAGQDQASAGEIMARDVQIQRITDAVESYILDKASLEGAVLTVDVTLGEDMLPVGAEMKGTVETEIRESLSEMLERELGIAKENQRWTG